VVIVLFSSCKKKITSQPPSSDGTLIQDGVLATFFSLFHFRLICVFKKENEAYLYIYLSKCTSKCL
jgi:hypothetical protein